MEILREIHPNDLKSPADLLPGTNIVGLENKTTIDQLVSRIIELRFGEGLKGRLRIPCPPSYRAIRAFVNLVNAGNVPLPEVPAYLLQKTSPDRNHAVLDKISLLIISPQEAAALVPPTASEDSFFGFVLRGRLRIKGKEEIGAKYGSSREKLFALYKAAEDTVQLRTTLDDLDLMNTGLVDMEKIENKRKSKVFQAKMKLTIHSKPSKVVSIGQSKRAGRNLQLEREQERQRLAAEAQEIRRQEERANVLKSGVEKSESIRAVSGGLPSLGKRR